jgi:hypothetical protein
MKDRRARRPMTRWTPYPGLHPPHQPGGGLLVLDRNPRAGSIWATSILSLLACGLWCGFAVSVFFALEHRSTGIFLFSAYLLAVSLLSSNRIAQILFSRERLWIGAGHLDYLSIVGLVRKWRTIPFEEIQRLTRYGVMVGDESQPLHPEYGLAIEMDGPTLRVGQSRDPDEVDQLQEEITRNLQEWYPALANGPRCPAREAAKAGRLLRTRMASLDVADRPDCEILDASGMRPEPPSDSALSCRREWDRTEFLLRIPAERSPSRHYSLVFACLWFGLLLAMMARPSVSIGVFVAALSAGIALTSALLRRRWVARPGEIRMSIPGLGLLWSRTIEIEWLEQIELRRIPPNMSWASSFQLALVDLDGTDKVVFGPLTEGEARWMAGIVAEVLKDALPKSGQEVYRWSVSVDEPTAGSKAMADAWLDAGLAGSGSKGSTVEQTG